VKRGFTRRRCPKCNGNFFVDRDNDFGTGGEHGWYEWCLQCSYVCYMEPAAILMEKDTGGNGHEVPK
jgi:transposase-like protein